MVIGDGNWLILVRRKRCDFIEMWLCDFIESDYEKELLL